MVQTQPFKLVVVVAPARVRYERSRRRGRVGDAATLEEFVDFEERENAADPAGQQLEAHAACLEATGSPEPAAVRRREAARLRSSP